MAVIDITAQQGAEALRSLLDQRAGFEQVKTVYEAQGAEGLKSLIEAQAQIIKQQRERGVQGLDFFQHVEQTLDKHLDIEFKRVSLKDLGNTYCILRKPGLDGYVLSVGYGNSPAEALTCAIDKLPAQAQ